MAAPERAHPQPKMKSAPALLLPPIRGPFFASSWQCSLGSGFRGGKLAVPDSTAVFLNSAQSFPAALRALFQSSAISHHGILSWQDGSQISSRETANGF